MLQLTVKRLLVCIAFLFMLNGCGSTGGDGGSESGNSGATVLPRGDGTALVTWTAPTENSDDSALTDLAGFKVYYGIFPGEYADYEVISNPGASSFLVKNLGDADWFFAVTAFNSMGIESSYSQEVHKQIN